MKPTEEAFASAELHRKLWDERWARVLAKLIAERDPLPRGK